MALNNLFVLILRFLIEKPKIGPRLVNTDRLMADNLAKESKEIGQTRESLNTNFHTLETTLKEGLMLRKELGGRIREDEAIAKK